MHMNIRTISLAALAVLPLAAFAGPGSPPAPAASVLANAEAKAKQSHKNVMLIFHASWCGWCHKLDDMLTKSPVADTMAKAYVVTHIDVSESPDKKSLENPGAAEQMASYGGATAGLPFFVILSPEGKVLGTSIAPQTGNVGFPAEPGEVAYFMQLMGKTTPNLNDGDRSKVEAFLRTPAKTTTGHR
jgi:thiol-disulfide isomerase/thioredoxin